MSETTKRQFVPTQAHLTQVHLPVDADSELAYTAQLLAKIQELFAEQPEATELLIGVDLNSFAQPTDAATLMNDLKKIGMSYQVVARGNKNAENTGVLVTRTKSE